MTNKEDLARRAVACKGWRWMPGMLDLWGQRILSVFSSGGVAAVFPAGIAAGVTGSRLPDLTDPATLGCLLALVREVVQDPGLHVRCMLPYAPDMSGRTPPPWLLYSGRGARWGDRHDTEAEALVAALEAAP